MNIEKIKNDFSVDYIKHINSDNTKYVTNDFSELMDTLYGGIPFNLNGKQLKFVKENDENILSDSDIEEILIKIYENLSPKLKDGFLNEALNARTQIPFDAGKYFENIKRTKEEKADIEENDIDYDTNDVKLVEPGTENLENDVEENGIDYDTNDVELAESETENLENDVEENDIDYDTNDVELAEPETEISFDNGPAISAYKEETLALEKEIEELEKQLREENISNNVTSIEDIKNEVASLVYPNIDPSMVTDEFMKSYYVFGPTTNLSEADQDRFLELKEEYFKIKNKTNVEEIDPLDKIKSEVASLVYPNIDPSMVTDEFMKSYYVFGPTTNLSEADQDRFLELKEEYFKIKNNMLTTNNNLTKQLEEKKKELEERKKNIELYDACLENIKNLYKKVQTGLDINSEEFKKEVETIDKKKVTLPVPLKNELAEFLMKIKEINKKTENITENKKKPVPIDKIEKNPKLTWKTFAFLASGLGMGALIGFTLPPLAAGAIGFGMLLAKGQVDIKRGQAKEKRLNGENEITGVEFPDNKLKAGIEKLKKYIKSEEGLRDISWGLTGGILGIATGIFVGLNKASTETITQNTQVNSPNVNNPQPVDTNPYSDIRIGDNVGSHNVSVGHDTANWAVNNTNPENLIGKYVNSDSVFQRFAEMNPDGSIKQIINTNGMSISDLQKMGVDTSRIAVDVGKNGISQAWVNLSELTKDIANVGRSIH